MKIWAVNFVVISPEDYCTPRMYLPNESCGGKE